MGGDRGGPGQQSVFQPPVEPLHQPVRLWVVISGGGVVDVEQTAQGRPQGGRELGPSVRGYGGWHSGPGDPACKEGSDAVCVGDGGKQDCLWPPRCSVEQVRVAA